MSHRRWHSGTWGTFPKLFSVLKHVRAHTAELVRPWAEQRGKQWGGTVGSGESELTAEPGALHKETDGFLAHTGCTELSDEPCGSQTASSRAERGARKPTLPCRTTGSDSEMKVMSRIFPRCDLYCRSGAQTPGNLHLLQMCRLIRMTQRSRSPGDVIEIKSPAFPPKMCCGCWQLLTATSHLCRQQVWGCGEPAWPFVCSQVLQPWEKAILTRWALRGCGHRAAGTRSKRGNQQHRMVGFQKARFMGLGNLLHYGPGKEVLTSLTRFERCDN